MDMVPTYRTSTTLSAVVKGAVSPDMVFDFILGPKIKLVRYGTHSTTVFSDFVTS